MKGGQPRTIQSTWKEQLLLNRKLHWFLFTILACYCFYKYLQFNSYLFISTNSMNSVDIESYAESDANINVWFISLSCSDKSFHLWAKIAVISAMRMTSLIPILILNGHDPDLENWMTSRNVTIVPVQSDPFLDKVLSNPRLRQMPNAFPLWARFIIPQAIDQLKVDDKFNRKMREWQRSPNFDYILYTDVDIIFVNRFHFQRKNLPRYLSFAVQGNAWCCWDKFKRKMHINDGILVMNVSGYKETFEELKQFLYHKSETYTNTVRFYRDQDAMRDFYPLWIPLSIWDKIELYIFHPHLRFVLSSKYYSTPLPKEYEWEPFLGHNDKAVIVHWAGPKYSIGSCYDLLQPLNYSRIDPYSIFGMINVTFPFMEQGTIPPFYGNNHLLFVNDWETTSAGYKTASELYFTFVLDYCASMNIDVHVNKQRQTIETHQQQQRYRYRSDFNSKSGSRRRRLHIGNYSAVSNNTLVAKHSSYPRIKRSSRW